MILNYSLLYLQIIIAIPLLIIGIIFLIKIKRENKKSKVKKGYDLPIIMFIGCFVISMAFIGNCLIERSDNINDKLDTASLHIEEDQESCEEDEYIELNNKKYVPLYDTLSGVYEYEFNSDLIKYDGAIAYLSDKNVGDIYKLFYGVPDKSMVLGIKNIDNNDLICINRKNVYCNKTQLKIYAKKYEDLSNYKFFPGYIGEYKNFESNNINFTAGELKEFVDKENRVEKVRKTIWDKYGGNPKDVKKIVTDDDMIIFKKTDYYNQERMFGINNDGFTSFDFYSLNKYKGNYYIIMDFGGNSIGGENEENIGVGIKCSNELNNTLKKAFSKD